MPTPPAATAADGNIKIVWVPTIADPTAPTATEVTAGTAVDLTCYLTASGWNPSLDEQVINDDRLCSVQTFERRGRFSRGLSLTFTRSPGSATDDKAYETLVPGTSGFIVERVGTDVDTALAASQEVWVWPVQAGARNPLPPEANGVVRVTQRMFVTGPTIEDAEIAA